MIIMRRSPDGEEVAGTYALYLPRPCTRGEGVIWFWSLHTRCNLLFGRCLPATQWFDSPVSIADLNHRPARHVEAQTSPSPRPAPAAVAVPAAIIARTTYSTTHPCMHAAESSIGHHVLAYHLLVHTRSSTGRWIWFWEIDIRASRGSPSETAFRDDGDGGGGERRHLRRARYQNQCWQPNHQTASCLPACLAGVRFRTLKRAGVPLYLQLD
jgi:hypothetical protein